MIARTAHSDPELAGSTLLPRYKSFIDSTHDSLAFTPRSSNATGLVG
jgi:hypothetical protein